MRLPSAHASKGPGSTDTPPLVTSKCRWLNVHGLDHPVLPTVPIAVSGPTQSPSATVTDCKWV